MPTKTDEEMTSLRWTIARHEGDELKDCARVTTIVMTPRSLTRLVFRKPAPGGPPARP